MEVYRNRRLTSERYDKPKEQKKVDIWAKEKQPKRAKSKKPDGHLSERKIIKRAKSNNEMDIWARKKRLFNEILCTSTSSVSQNFQTCLFRCSFSADSRVFLAVTWVKVGRFSSSFCRLSFISFGSKLFSFIVCSLLLITFDGLADKSSTVFLLAITRRTWRSLPLSSGSWLWSFFCWITSAGPASVRTLSLHPFAEHLQEISPDLVSTSNYK